MCIIVILSLKTGYYFKYVFFFSSRRRHTRLQGDWSSDVCSSDLHFVGRVMTRPTKCLRMRPKISYGTRRPMAPGVGNILISRTRLMLTPAATAFSQHP